MSNEVVRPVIHGLLPASSAIAKPASAPLPPTYVEYRRFLAPAACVESEATNASASTLETSPARASGRSDEVVTPVMNATPEASTVIAVPLSELLPPKYVEYSSPGLPASAGLIFVTKASVPG